MSNPFDALRKVIEHEANQDDDNGFFAKLYGFQPEHDDEGPTARGLFQHRDVERGGPAVKWKPIPGRTGGIIGDKHFPPGLSRIGTINRSSYPGFFTRGGIIRTCIVWKHTKTLDILTRSFWQGTPWRWSCRKCPAQGAQQTWETAYATADRHARNHHRSQK